MGSKTYNTVGQHEFWFPDGVSEITVEIYGAGGGDGGQAFSDSGNTSSPGVGGTGGYVKATIDATQSDNVAVYVGGKGQDGGDATTDNNGGSGGSGGTNGGYAAGADGYAGSGDTNEAGGGGGGGGACSAVRNAVAPTYQIAAGGGGGGGGAGATYSGPFSTGYGPGGDAGGGSEAGGGQRTGEKSYYGTSPNGGDGGYGGADGSTPGGDGGDGTYGDQDDGTNQYSIVSTTKGGGNSGNGKVVFTWTDTPSAPSSLSASASNDDVSLSWTDNSGNEDGFYVYRATSSGSSTSDYTKIATLSSNTTSYTDSGLSNDQDYYYRVSAYNSGGESSLSNESSATTQPSAPSSLSASSSSDDISLSWTDNSTYENGFRVYRATSSGSSTSDYSQIADLSSNTTSYSDTGLNDGEKYYYRVTAYNGAGSTLSNEANATTSLPSPSGASASVNNNASIDVTWTDNSDNEDNFRVQISRDGASYVNPSGGPTTPGSNSTSANYNPNSDNSYDSQVGIDSSFQFRVRAETEHVNSSWNSTGTVYTDPIPPHNPSVSRSDGTSITISWSNQSNIENGVEIQYREDTGSGYGSWSTATTTTSGSTSYSDSSLPQDVRRQYRLRTKAPDGGTSDWVYADYGNNGNVYFTDDFEDQDLSEWDTTSLDGESGIFTGSNIDDEEDLGISGADQGSYFLQIDSNGYVTKNLGDLSGESNVIVKCAKAAGSMDSGSENVRILWYDGSSWQTLTSFSHEYNEQGWVEVTAKVPDSYLSTDNRVRFDGYGGGGDYMAVDRVVVSDILHEYTLPTAPTNLKSKATGDEKLQLTWTDNATFEDRYEIFYKKTTDGSYTKDQNASSNSTSATITGLTDATRYDLKTREVVEQARNGSFNSWWYHDNIHPTISTAYGIFKLNTPSGTLSVPVFDPQDVANPIVRTKTANGVAAFNFVSTGNADQNQLRIETQNKGILALKTEAQN